MMLMRFRRSFAAAALAALFAVGLFAAPAPAVTEAEQLRIIQATSELLRARVDKLPVLIPASFPVGKIAEQTVQLNRDAVEVSGQRFDGVLVTAPKEKASFAWAFVTPANTASWSILREKGDMKGFTNFLRRPRAQVPLAAAMKPESRPEIIFQQLDRTAWAPDERYILWFRFKDAVPAEFTIRAGFFDRPSLNNNALPMLLFPPAVAK
jgi:hypothetical protein